MRRAAVFCTIMLVSLLGQVQAGDARLRISVSATVPPRPCMFPEICPQAAATLSRARISGERILYVGWQPVVVTDGDMLVVRF